jgi:hypothetical protein
VAPQRDSTHRDEVLRWIEQRVRRDPHMQAAGARDQPAPPQLGATNDDADLVALLPRDHNGFHKLVTRLQYTPTAANGATPDQIAERAAIVDAIRDGLQRHEAAEEQHLWPFVTEALPNGSELAHQARAQEQQGSALLDALARATPGSDEFDDLAEQLQHALRSHVAFEDRVLLALRNATSAEARAAVGEALARVERSASP